jgi:hypothetical protein
MRAGARRLLNRKPDDPSRPTGPSDPREAAAPTGGAVASGCARVRQAVPGGVRPRDRRRAPEADLGPSPGRSSLRWGCHAVRGSRTGEPTPRTGDGVAWSPWLPRHTPVIATIAMTRAAGTDHQSLAAMTGRPISTHAPEVRASLPLHRSPQTNLQTAASQWKIVRQALFGGDFSVWAAATSVSLGCGCRSTRGASGSGRDAVISALRAGLGV